MIVVRAFVSHAFDDALYPGGRAAFRTAVGDLVKAACARLTTETRRVCAELLFEARRAGHPLMYEIREQLSRCDFVIADISTAGDDGGVNPNVMYEIGYAMALGKQLIVMRRASRRQVPSDIGDLLAVSYDRVEAIPETFAEDAARVVSHVLSGTGRRGDRVASALEKIWFPKGTSSIAIVCTPDPDASEFSRADHPDFVDVDRFDDRDALLELSTFFARRYPEAQVVRYLSDELPQQALDGNLVVLGGPGCAPDEGNELARDLMTSLGSVVRYSDDGDGLFWRGDPVRRTRFDARGRVVEDWAVFLAAPNPYNPATRVVLVNGVRTYGTLAAALTFVDAAAAAANHAELAAREVRDQVTGHLDFELLIKVEVGPNRRIRPPSPQWDLIRRIGG